MKAPSSGPLITPMTVKEPWKGGESKAPLPWLEGGEEEEEE